MGKRGGGDAAPLKVSELHGYINGSSFVKKVKQETSQVRAREGHSPRYLSVQTVTPPYPPLPTVTHRYPP